MVLFTCEPLLSMVFHISTIGIGVFYRRTIAVDGFLLVTVSFVFWFWMTGVGVNKSLLSMTCETSKI